MNICPRCGTPTVQYLHDTGSDDPTSPASSVQQPLPATKYGPDQHIPPSPPQNDGNRPYEAPAQHPYLQDPYHSMQPLQSPSRKNRKGPIAFVISLILLLVIIGASVLVLFNTHKLPGSQTTQGAIGAATTPSNSSKTYPPGTGTLVMNDPMQDNSKGYGWSQFIRTNSTACHFTAGAYEIDTPIHLAQVCYTNNSPQLSNFAFEAQMKIVKGDCGAIVFRVDRNNGNWYQFEVCRGSRYAVNLRTSKGGFKVLLDVEASPEIHIEQGQSNLLAVVAMGNIFTLYLNHQKIDSTADNTYSQGQFGVYAAGYYGDPTEVLFSNMKVWKL
jgi:eukaryotic-like serine/threonine-protein kinase